MAGKATSVYLTVSDKSTHKAIFHKMFFNATEMNKFTATDEFKEKYITPEFYLTKEVY
mgnify:CR=1 FL=1|jgi:hypothetical protein